MKRLAIIAVVVATAASVGTARAGTLLITVSEGATLYDIVDEGPLDLWAFPNPDAINKIVAQTAALVFLDYKIVELTASTNNPGAPDPNGAVLRVSGEVQRFLTGGAAPPLIITVTDTDYSVPAGALDLFSSASDAFTNAPSGDSHTFTSWFNPTNTSVAKDLTSGALTFTSSGLPLNSNNGDTDGITVGPAALYGLTNETVITLSGASADIVFGGSTQVLPSEVPEPASYILLGIGGLGLLGNYWRRSRQPEAGGRPGLLPQG